jgi:hypothetical protein
VSQAAANAVALQRERDKRQRTTTIASGELVLAIRKAERKSEREWAVIVETLQKQVGVEQTRVAQMQLQSTKAEVSYQKRAGRLERDLAQEYAARKQEQDDYKVTLCCSCLRIHYL